MKELSDFELNKAIAEAMGYLVKKAIFHNLWIMIKDNEEFRLFDFNNRNDLGLLVEKHRLIIVPYKNDLWEAYPESGEFVIYNKKYLRAGAECLLKLLTKGEQGNE